MKPFLSLLAILYSFVSVDDLFAQKKTEHYWGKRGYDIAYSCAATDDGGYIITGLSQSSGDTVGDIIVIRLNAHGDTVWSLLHGGPLLEGGNYVMQTADGGFMVSGHTEDFGAQDCDAFLMKLDRDGKYQWLKVYGGEEDDISEGVVELPSGEFVIAGITASYGNPIPSEVRHAYFVKTTSTGDAIWTKYYAGAGTEYAYSIAKVGAGGFLAVGYTTSFGNGEKDGWLLRLDDNGDTLWTRRYVNAGESRYYKIQPTMDNGYIIAGFTTKTATCKPQGLIVKLDAEGNKMWELLYGDTTQGMMLRDVVQLPTGNFMFPGISYANDAKGTAYILTTDAKGNMITEQSFGGSSSGVDCIAAQGNNSYLVGGIACKNDVVYGDLFYMEHDNTVANVPLIDKSTPLIYPNPVRSQPTVIILPSEAANQYVHLVIVDMNGRQALVRDKILAKDIVIDRTMLASGQYLFHITCGDGSEYKGTLIVE